MLNEPEREGAGPGGPNHDLTTETGATPTAYPLLDIGANRWSCLCWTGAIATNPLKGAVASCCSAWPTNRRIPETQLQGQAFIHVPKRVVVGEKQGLEQVLLLTGC